MTVSDFMDRLIGHNALSEFLAAGASSVIEKLMIILHILPDVVSWVVALWIVCFVVFWAGFIIWVIMYAIFAKSEAG
jgi:hypothetical protein